MSNTEQGFNDLTNFNWEANPNEVDFFGIKAEVYQEQVNQDKIREKAFEDNDEEKAKEQQENEEKPPVFESFTDEDTKSEEGETKVKTKSPGRPAKEEPINFKEQFNSFKEQGIIKHIDLEEDLEELDNETFKDLIEQDYEEEVSHRIEQWATQELDEDAQAFIKFKKNGGRTEDFFKTVANNSSVLSGDIEDERFQDKIIRKQLSEEGWDDEEIQDRLENLAKFDKKQTVAEKYYNKIKIDQKKKADELLRKQEEYRRSLEQNKANFKNTVKETLNKVQEVRGIRITTKDRASLFNFITKEDQVVGDRNVTGFQRAITEAVQDPEKMLLLAKLLASDFDMTDLEKKAKLTETKKIKENLESRKDLRPSESRGSQLTGGKSLSDLWN